MLVDFILSVEIIIIALSQVVESDLIVQVLVVSLIALVATVGVYGLVALIVRMDDAGLALTEREEAWAQSLGRGMVRALPILIRIIGHIGTVALLLVAGGIFHHIEAVHHLFHGWPGLLVDGLLGARRWGSCSADRPWGEAVLLSLVGLKVSLSFSRRPCRHAIHSGRPALQPDVAACPSFGAVRCLQLCQPD